MSNILIISGTNRPAANTLLIAQTLQRHYRSAGTSVELLSLADLSKDVFDPTSYATKPASFVAIQQKVVDSSGLHIVTPEYNGSFPGVLKYFIDMLKFPESFESKPVAFTGLAAGLWGALRSVEQLAQIFSYRNAHLFPDRVFIPGVGQKIGDGGQLTDASIDQRLHKQSAGFAQYVKLFAK